MFVHTVGDGSLNLESFLLVVDIFLLNVTFNKK
jgi:hypothetical protein